jgi:flagellar motor switch protein FliN/FliY
MANTEQAVEEKQDQQNDSENGTSKAQAQSVELSEAADTQEASASGNIDILLDMNVPITVAIGDTNISVRRLLQLGPGSVLKLEKSVDAPADIYLKDTKFATGDVVVVDEKFAIRVKQILAHVDSAAKESEA